MGSVSHDSMGDGAVADRTMDGSGYMVSDGGVEYGHDTVYPYLLRGVGITHCDQVWSSDITPSFPGQALTLGVTILFDGRNHHCLPNDTLNVPTFNKL